LRRRIDVPALFAVLTHPQHGVGLFDTGYSTRFYQATAHWPFRVYRWLTPAQVSSSEDAREQLRDRGIEPGDVAWIIVSHFDPDHVGGLGDFPNARVFCAREAWESIEGLRGIAALRKRLLPELVPHDLSRRLTLIDPPTSGGLGPVHATHDLFGDGAIRLAWLPGHAPGHLGAIVRTQGGKIWFLAADAAWCRAAIRAGGGAIHRRLAHDRARQDSTYTLLQRVSAAFPEWVIIPSHCPEAASLLAGGSSGTQR